jgi:hypothetical protein
LYLQTNRLKADLGGRQKVYSYFMPLPVNGKSTSTWFALRNPVFFRLWFATLLSGTFVSSQDVVATWLMHYFELCRFGSPMATAASAPSFFHASAGAVADIANRRTVISAVLWQAAWSVILAIGAWTEVFAPRSVLACIFALGIGLAFGAPVWESRRSGRGQHGELPSAITLGGVQLNSPALGSALGGCCPRWRAACDLSMRGLVLVASW